VSYFSFYSSQQWAERESFRLRFLLSIQRGNSGRPRVVPSFEVSYSSTGTAKTWIEGQCGRRLHSTIVASPTVVALGAVYLFCLASTVR